MSIETYGFAIYISAFALSAVWLSWSFIPDSILNYIGIIYYPSKYWASTIPSLIIVAYISWFIYYTISVLVMTQSRNISSTYKDTYTKLAKPFDDISIPPLCDISIEAVNKSLNSDNKFIDD